MRWDLVRSLVIWLIAFSPLWILVGVLVYSVRRRRALAGVPDERKPAWLRGPSVRATLRDWWRLPVPKRVGAAARAIAGAAIDGLFGDLLLWGFIAGLVCLGTHVLSPIR